MESGQRILWPLSHQSEVKNTFEETLMANVEIGSQAPDFTLDDCYGNTVSLSDLKGKKVLLYFYTSSGGGN